MGNCKIWILFCNEKMIQIDRCCFDIVCIVKCIKKQPVNSPNDPSNILFFTSTYFFFHTYRVQLKRKYLFRSQKKRNFYFAFNKSSCAWYNTTKWQPK